MGMTHTFGSEWESDDGNGNLMGLIHDVELAYPEPDGTDAHPETVWQLYVRGINVGQAIAGPLAGMPDTWRTAYSEGYEGKGRQSAITARGLMIHVAAAWGLACAQDPGDE